MKLALCLLLQSSRRWLLEKLLPRWSAINFGGDDPVWVVGRHDADDATVAWFKSAARWPVIVADPVDPATVATFPTTRRPGEAGPVYTNAEFARFGHLRERVRQAALTSGADLAWWLDSDIDPGKDAYRHLREDIRATTGRFAPHAVAGVYSLRTQGIHQGGPVGKATLPAGYVGLCGSRDATGVPNPGFGCVLMDRQALAGVDWSGFPGTLRTLPPDERMPEDLYWYGRCLFTLGVHPLIDTRVVCRHYHGDGSYWTFREAGGVMVPQYVITDAEPSRQVRVTNTGRKAIWWTPLPGYPLAFVIDPGKADRVSPDWADALTLHFPGKVRVTSSRPAAAAA